MYFVFPIVLLQCFRFIVRQNHCDICKDLTNVTSYLKLTGCHSPGKFVREEGVKTAPFVDKPVQPWVERSFVAVNFRCNNDTNFPSGWRNERCSISLNA